MTKDIKKYNVTGIKYPLRFTKIRLYKNATNKKQTTKNGSKRLLLKSSLCVNLKM
tara:strand:- start:57600 stop:57764 length:165 start_codon:yes stop_codon:yes gene_type:complete